MVRIIQELLKAISASGLKDVTTVTAQAQDVDKHAF